MRRIRRRTDSETTALVEIPVGDIDVLQVCHPDWRGVRSSALAFGDPVLESSDLADVVPHIEELTARGTRTVVIQGWPAGSRTFAEAASNAGMSVLTVFHSSPAQHGVDGGESEAVTEMFALAAEGAVSRVGTVKAGVVDAYRAIGCDVVHIPNRPPHIDAVDPVDVPAGTNVGVFLFPMWRKNVTTQVLAGMENGWRPYVMLDPDVGYIPSDALVATGELPRDEFLRTKAAMDITMNVTLSECHPMMPMESYRLGVPCLISRTSDLFTDDQELLALTSVTESDDPSAIARAAKELLENRDRAVSLATASLDRLDVAATTAWMAFTGR
jgi:hypothetical protein